MVGLATSRLLCIPITPFFPTMTGCRLQMLAGSVQKSAPKSPQPLELVVLWLPHTKWRPAFACLPSTCRHWRASPCSCSESLRQKALDAQFRDLFLHCCHTSLSLSFIGHLQTRSSNIRRLQTVAAILALLTSRPCCAYPPLSLPPPHV